MGAVTDPNLILSLRTDNPYLIDLFELPQNKRRHAPPTRLDGKSRTRESTPSMDRNCTVQQIHQLCLTFDQPPRRISQGFLFGTDKSCDVILANAKGKYGISGYHFSITFDDEGRIVLEDNSKNGTAVTDDDKSDPKFERNSSWVLIPGKIFTVHLTSDLFFDIEVAQHDPSDRLYRVNVDSYLEKKRKVACLKSVLEDRSLTHTQMQNMSQDQSTYEFIEVLKGGRPHMLGSGGFGQVFLMEDARTGKRYAQKRYSGSTCAKEHDILLRASHRHVVRYVQLKSGTNFSDGNCQLTMEYFPLGDLMTQYRECSLSRSETRQLLLQCLDALAYLDTLNIAHRDIKSQNILVRQRGANFYVKLADFGLAKDTSSLKTDCGTLYYFAPEITNHYMRYAEAADGRRCYDRKVDVWALGQVILEVVLRGRLKVGPKARNWHEYTVSVARKLVERNPNEPLFALLKEMLQIDPENRPIATEALAIAQATLPVTDDPVQWSEGEDGINAISHRAEPNREKRTETPNGETEEIIFSTQQLPSPESNAGRLTASPCGAGSAPELDADDEDGASDWSLSDEFDKATVIQSPNHTTDQAVEPPCAPDVDDSYEPRSSEFETVIKRFPFGQKRRRSSSGSLDQPPAQRHCGDLELEWPAI